MKKIFSFTLCLTLFFAIFFLAPRNVEAYTNSPLDEILEYDIWVTPNDDATLELKYHIKWKVLDSTSDGPLSWVQIGVPNRFVSNIATTDTFVDKIKYHYDSGSYVALYFKNNYYSGDVIDFNFSFHQDRIYTMNNNYVSFSFKPGWFDEISVDSINVYWLKANVAYENSNGESLDGLSYKWSYSLEQGETIKVDVSYPEAVFPNKDLDKQYSNETQSKFMQALPIYIFIGIILIVVIFRIVRGFTSGGGYYAFRGYSGYGFYLPFHLIFGHHGVDRHGSSVGGAADIVNSHSGGTYHGGSSCACACACACAGGGRAGCSRKDFYNTKTIDLITRHLSK